MADRLPSAAEVRGWRHVRAAIVQFREEAARRGDPCWLCSKAIDYDLGDPYDDWAFECDHVLSVSKHPEHAADPANMRASHRLCNRRKSNDANPQGLGITSEDWEGMADDDGQGAATSRPPMKRARRRGEEWDDDDDLDVGDFMFV